MFALRFRFPAGRYHATPWGRGVNEADVAWPPEPWRLLRTLIAMWRRKGDHERWSEEQFAQLIDALAGTLPEYRLPKGAIHAHTRHYMPLGTLAKNGLPKPTLVFDAFLRLPVDATVVACWPDLSLEPELFALAADLADAVGYLGRAESWAECEALSEWDSESNCRPIGGTLEGGDPVRLIAPVSAEAYSTERQRIMSEMRERIKAESKKPLSERAADTKLKRTLTSKKGGGHTLPERLVDALTLDTSDYQDRGWSRPPASQEVVYSRASEVAPGVVSGRARRRRALKAGNDLPTVARFLLAGRPLPRIEDAVKVGELMRLAALARFGWRDDGATGRRIPNAPPEISGRGADGKPLMDPSHTHAFWLPEDATGDGWIDHVSVYVPAGMTANVQAKLDRITRLWLAEKQSSDEEPDEPGRKEWRLALEGFGKRSDFAGDTGMFAEARCWRSVTPFLAAGHLKKASGYAGEVRRLLQRRGCDPTGVEVTQLCSMDVGGTERRPIHFHRFRSRGRERQPDATGAFLQVVFPEPFMGPLCLGYGSHFGLGLFGAESCGDA